MPSKCTGAFLSLRFLCGATLFLLFLSTDVFADAKTKKEVLPKLVYNFISGTRDPLDEKVEALYRGITKIQALNVPEGERTVPTLQRRTPLRTISDGADGIVLGKILVAAIVDESGNVQAPKVLESSDPRLIEPVLANVKDSKFVPSTFRRKSVASLVVNVYEFPDQPLENVSYVKADSSTNDAAKERLLQFLSAPTTSNALSLGQEGSSKRETFLGAFLSDRLTRDFSWTSNEKKGTYRLPLSEKPHLEGEMPLVLLSKEETTKNFRALWSKLFPENETPTIRPLELKEIALIWYFISWHLEEPLFVVETSHRILVFDLDAKGEHIDWLEDISHPCLTVGPEVLKDAPCFCADVQTKGKKWTVLFKESKLCPQGKSTSAGKGGDAEANPNEPKHSTESRRGI